MQFRSLIYSFCLLAISLLPLSAQRTNPFPAPKDKAGWVAAIPGLTMQDGFWLSKSFSKLDYEKSYAILSENWNLFKDVSVRAEFMQSLLTPPNPSLQNFDELENPIEAAPNLAKFNPHLLDLLELCLSDPHPNFSWVANKEIKGLTQQEQCTLASFQKWRKELGTQTLEDHVRSELQNSLVLLKSGSITEKKATLGRLINMPFYNGEFTNSINGVTTHGVTAEGLTSVRREVMKNSGIIDILKEMLNSDAPSELYEPVLHFLIHFFIEDSELAKMEPTLKRILPGLVDKPKAKIDPNNPVAENAMEKEYEIISFLSRCKGDWAVDIQLKKLKEGANADAVWPIINSLKVAENPKAIPVLIGFLDKQRNNSPIEGGYNMADQALMQITGLYNNGGESFNRKRDSSWWRIWWHDNKRKYSIDIQRTQIAYRRLNLSPAQSLLYKRKMELCCVSNDPDRSYWLITPGQKPPSPPAPGADTNIKVLKTVGPAKAGLMLILAERGNIETMKDVCLSASNDFLGKDYIFAVLETPASGDKAPGGWLTKQNIATFSPGTRYSTEDYVSQIVQQLELNAAIDPNRVFLLGEGNAGAVAYSCSLQKSTPFAGFCLLSAPFRTAALPSLALARGRRFFIQTGSRDQGGVSVLSGAAEAILKRQGAIVKAVKYQGNMSSLLEEGDFAPIKSALQWLESKQ